MKKLLIAMSAAAMFSLCAKAESTTLLGGIDFETGYSAGDPIATGSIDPSDLDPNPNELIFWAGDNGESEIVEADNNKYLKVDTTAELTRKTAELTASDNPFDPVAIGDGDITVSAKVQFTAADEAPGYETGDKLIVWAKAPDEDDPNSTTTNLMVTAKTAEGVVTNFVTDVLVDAETWYNLEIKAVATGSENDGDASAAFTVSIAPAGSSPVAVTVDGQAATFKSLLNDNVTGAQTIASIGFKGTGAVDDIVFAKNEAAEPVTVTLAYTCNVEDVVSILDADGEDAVTANVGETVTILVNAASDTTVTGTGLTFAYIPFDETTGTGYDAWVATYTLTATDGEAGSKTFAITVGGQSTTIVPNMDNVPASVTFSPEFAASYAAGDKIDPTKITASTSKAGYTVSFEISVNGTPIVAETTLAAGDTVTVTATETAIEYTITYTYADANSNPLTDVENTNPTTFTVEDAVTIDSAKISKEGYTVTSVTPATIAQGTIENQTVAVVLTAVPTYTVTAAAVEGATVTFSTTDPVVSGTTVTFTIAVTDETKEIDTVKNGETELTANEGVYSVTVVDADIVITVTLKNKSTPSDFVPTYIEGKSQATIAKYKAWARKYGDDELSANEDAYLLNCAPSEVAAAKAAFKFTSITPGVIPTISGDNYNGVVVILGGTSLSDIATWDKATTSDTFFKATLVVEETND